jgi:hypothetical protein
MDFNNPPLSEVKTRREKFSVSIRRHEQDRFFNEHRKRIMTGSLIEQKSHFQQESVKSKPLNQESINEFANMRSQLIELMSQRRFDAVLDLLKNARAAVSSSLDPELVPLEEFFESGMPKVLLTMTTMEEVVRRESMVNELVWILSNLFAAPSEYVQQLMSNGVLVFFSQQLTNADPVMTEHILWSFANLLADNAAYYEDMMNYQIWNSVLERVNLFIKNERIARTASWLFSNAVHYNDAPFELVS